MHEGERVLQVSCYHPLILSRYTPIPTEKQNEKQQQKDFSKDNDLFLGA